MFELLICVFKAFLIFHMAKSRFYILFIAFIFKDETL